MKILFVLKERFYSNTNIKSYGLINSSLHVCKHLNSLNIQTKVVTVVDGNDIDREVHNYYPDIVIIEALWVTADKLKELINIKRYKHIKWVVRIHSDVGFLAAETLALKYINDYIALNEVNLIIAPNNKKFNDYLSNALGYSFEYLPNIVDAKPRNYNDSYNTPDIINIGCFGSLRILKNQLFQAICAINAADFLDKTLHFHITVDVNADNQVNPVLKNLEELFKNSRHKLIKHSWMENNEFQNLIKKMDLGLQLSYSESFNIVTADFVYNNILILVSDSIDWMPNCLKISTIDYDQVTRKIISLFKKRNSRCLKNKMHKALRKYNIESEKIWFDFIIDNDKRFDYNI